MVINMRQFIVKNLIVLLYNGITGVEALTGMTVTTLDELLKSQLKQVLSYISHKEILVYSNL